MTWRSDCSCLLQGQPTNFTMELSGPAVDQLAAQSGDSAQFQQAIASLLPGISELLPTLCSTNSWGRRCSLASRALLCAQHIAVYTRPAATGRLALSWG